MKYVYLLRQGQLYSIPNRRGKCGQQAPPGQQLSSHTLIFLKACLLKNLPLTLPGNVTGHSTMFDGVPTSQPPQDPSQILCNFKILESHLRAQGSFFNRNKPF